MAGATHSFPLKLSFSLFNASSTFSSVGCIGSPPIEKAPRLAAGGKTEGLRGGIPRGERGGTEDWD